MDVMPFPADPDLDLRAYVARLFERSRAEVPDVNVANLLHCAADTAVEAPQTMLMDSLGSVPQSSIRNKMPPEVPFTPNTRARFGERLRALVFLVTGSESPLSARASPPHGFLPQGASATASDSGRQDAAAVPSAAAAVAPSYLGRAPSGDASSRGLPPRPPVPAFAASVESPAAGSQKPPLPVGKGFGQRFASREGGPRPAPLGGVRNLQKQQAVLMRMCAEASTVLQGAPPASDAEPGREGPAGEAPKQTLFIQDVGISPGALLQTPQAGNSSMAGPSPLCRGTTSGLTPPTPGAAGRGQERQPAAAGISAGPSAQVAAVGPAGQLASDAPGLAAMTPRTELASIYSEMKGVIESGADYEDFKGGRGSAAAQGEGDGALLVIDDDQEIMGGGFSDLDKRTLSDVMDELVAEGMVNDGGASLATPLEGPARVKEEHEEVAAEEAVAEEAAEDDDVMPADDGYSWRKYGQRQVRGREHPRCYYKCRHPGCPVRKQEERMADTGEVVERVYRGLHNHPPPGRKAADATEVHGDLAGTEGYQENVGPDGLRLKEEYGQGCAVGGKRSPDDRDRDEDETAAEKKRRLDIEAVGASEVVEQQRLVLELRSEVEILDDGYRWRKYGQKVVRGNLHPRSYYKCTHPECGVRKQVERSVKDPMVVITTYEGRHNHEVPGGLLGAPQM